MIFILLLLMLRILYVAQTFYPTIGGAERYIDRLAQAISERGHKVYVMAPTTQAKELKRDYNIIRVGFYNEYKKGILYFLRALPMARKIVKFIQKNQIDILHFQYINPFTLPIKYLKSTGVKVFASSHGSDLHFMEKDWFGSRLLPHIFNSINGLMPVSDYCGNHAKRLNAPKEKIHVIYNATNPDIFTPAPDEVDHFNILSASRLIPKKDITTLLRAFKIVKKFIPNASLIIAGDGPDKTRLIRLTKKLKLNNNVKFTGFVSEKELHFMYKRTGIFILPAKFDPSGQDIEGFGITLVESMASGRPVIGGKIGGIPSAIKRDWGYLYEPEDWRDLANKIIYLMKHPELADRMGREGRKAVENIYNWNYVAKQMEKIYVSAK